MSLCELPTAPAWFVVNPGAGGVRYGEVAAEIRHQLAGRDAVISWNTPTDTHDRRLVVAVGGDGTVNRVINHCDPERLRLGIIPRGSANDLSRTLAIPRDFLRAWTVLESSEYAAIDLLTVNGARFATCGGLGLPSDVAAAANRWKARPGPLGRCARRLGPLVYLLAALTEMAQRGSGGLRARIDTGDGRCRTADLTALLVSNQARFGRWFSASPRASNRDGRLHLCGIEAPRTRARLLWICAQLLNGHPERCPEIFEVEVRSATVETDAPTTFFGDGEMIAHGRTFRLDVLPAALQVSTALRSIAVA
jgi:diacylglycerol kinase (ATP)